MSRHFMLTFAFLLLSLLAASLSVNAAPLEDTSPLQERATAGIVAPTAYKISWTETGKRASTGASTGGLGYTFIATTGGVTQALVNTCATKCTSTATCGMYQIFQVNGASAGTVVCSLHNQYVASTKTTYTTGPTGGTVVTTYGIRNLATAVSGSSSTTTSSATFPASPPGATLIQVAPCSAVTKASVPVFVNNQYGGSQATAAYIVQHGSGLNFQDYFTAVYNVIGTRGIIAAPNYYTSTSAVAPTTWYQPAVNLAWDASAAYSWSIGADAIKPNAVACSSYDVYDALLSYFSDKSKFPHLTNVYFVSHSGGGNMVSRYSQIYNGNFGFKFRYIVANAANQAYFDNSRPEAGVSSCTAGFQYPFQLVSSGMPRYVAARFSNAATIFRTWISRDVVTLVGTYDTEARYPGGVEDCGSQAQGGNNRRDRNYAWWAYTNILAGTGANVAAYTGYQQLIASGAKTLYKGAFNHQNCDVDGAGHDQNVMFSSACGVAAMTAQTLPAGAGANYDGGN